MGLFGSGSGTRSDYFAGTLHGCFLQVRGLLQHHRISLVAAGIFLGSTLYYGLCLYPGVGGVINEGDSAKFQTLALAPIMVHGPGNPLYLLLAAGIRALDLPLSGWWQIAFILSALPGALANAVAFLLVRQLTGGLLYGVAAALLLGSAHLMLIQSTEAEVYALNILFVLTTVYLLILLVQKNQMYLFFIACAVYAISFGNHVMMIMLLPLFVGLTVLHHRRILRPRPIAIILLFVLLGASQYLYLVYAAYHPDTFYAEYITLPPPPAELLRYIFATYFSGLYGSGLESPRNLIALGDTFHRAHPWVSVPLIALGLPAFLLCGRRGWRDGAWRGLALVYAGAFCFLLFALWYGALDIEAFHLPVLTLAILGAVGSLGLAAKRHPLVFRCLALALLLLGVYRTADAGIALAHREAAFTGLVPGLRDLLAQLPPEDRPPLVTMGYGVRMAVLYHSLAGDLPQGPEYNFSWRPPPDTSHRSILAGVMIAVDSRHFVRSVERLRPDMSCTTGPLDRPDRFRWQVLRFRCTADTIR